MMGNLMRLLIKLCDGIADVPKQRLRELWTLGELRASKVVVLEDIDQCTRERISPQVAAAERSLEIRSSWIRAVDGLPDRFPVLWVVLAGTYIGIGWAMFRWIGDGAPAPKIIPLAVLLLALFIASSIITRILYTVLGSAGELLAMVILPVVFVGLARNPGWWQEWLNLWLQQVNLVALESFFGSSINNALGISAALFAVLTIHRLVVFAAHARGPREAESDLACALLLNGFLDVALKLQGRTTDSRVRAVRQVNPEGRRSVDTRCEGGSVIDAEEESELAAEAAGIGLRLHIADDSRLGLVQELESLARFTERQWRRALRTGDPAVDLEVDRIATGIASRIRYWKTTAVLGGADLVRMRKAFSAAVVNISDEDWKAMAVAVSDRDLVGLRIVNWIRSIAAAVVLVGTITILVAKPFAWVVVVHESGMGNVVLVLAVAAASFLEPRVRDRIVGQINQVGSVKNALV
ncbi:hypothetical protein [Microlunatus sp. GCM10028923]|uniref:hypothetical protein n=1 Tax=Microlunatus sp. GCM10028923 TaxID=3273400 RepID=UPI003608F49F